MAHLASKKRFYRSDDDTDHGEAHCSILNPGSSGMDNLDARLVEPRRANYFREMRLLSTIIGDGGG